ncbi:hypothetical protein BgiBS90_017151, partial [Biomphalaria glabrata]
SLNRSFIRRTSHYCALMRPTYGGVRGREMQCLQGLWRKRKHQKKMCHGGSEHI